MLVIVSFTKFSYCSLSMYFTFKSLRSSTLLLHAILTPISYDVYCLLLSLLAYTSDLKTLAVNRSPLALSLSTSFPCVPFQLLLVSFGAVQLSQPKVSYRPHTFYADMVKNAIYFLLCIFKRSELILTSTDMSC